jgi:actin-related protein
MEGAVEGDHFVGSRVEQLRGMLKIRYPIEHGIVSNWTEMEYIWNHAYHELRVSPVDVSHHYHYYFYYFLIFLFYSIFFFFFLI